MREIKDQMQEIKRRKEIYAAVKALRQKMIAEAAACAVCAAVLVAVVCFLPRIRQLSEQAPIRQYGSMILEMPVVGYVLVALLAFILGMMVSMLCQHWKQRKKKEDEI